MKKTAPHPPPARDERRPVPPSDSDRMARGLAMESGESLPRPKPRLH